MCISPLDLKKAAVSGILNTFIDLGISKGLQRNVVFTRKVMDAKNLRVDDLPINTAEFKHLYIYEFSTVVGSLVASRAKFTVSHPYSVTFIPHSDRFPFVCPTEHESSGVYVANDGNGGYGAIISNLPHSDLIVYDRE